MMTSRYRRRVAAGLLTASSLLGSAGCGPAGPHPTEAPAELATPWAWELPQCVGYQPAAYESPAHRVSAEVRVDGGWHEQVERYQAGWGELAFAEIRTVLRECASYEHGGSGDPAAYREQHLLVTSGFAGEDSLLVETVRLQPPQLRSWCTTVVRSHDVVVTVRVAQPASTEVSCVAAVAAIELATSAPAQT